MSLRADLADIFLGDGDVLCHRAGDQDLMVLVVDLLLDVLATHTGRTMRSFQPLGASDHDIKMRVNLGSVQRRDVHMHLVQAEDPAADQDDDQHQGFHQPSQDGLETIHLQGSCSTLSRSVGRGNAVSDWKDPRNRTASSCSTRLDASKGGLDW